MLGKSAEEIALTKHLSKTLVQKEVMEPMEAIGFRHGQPPNPAQAAVLKAEAALAAGVPVAEVTAFLKERNITYTPPAGGLPAKPEGAPAPVVAPVVPVTSGQPAPIVTPAPVTPAKTDVPADLAAAQNVLSLMESLRGTDGKIMGKYTSVEEGLKGAGHLANMAKSALKRAEEAEARLAALSTPGVAAPLATVPVVTPPLKPFVPASRPELERAQARLDKVLLKVKEDGFDGDSAREFADANREVAEQTSRAVAAEERERNDYTRSVEDQKWTVVNAFMAEKYPDSVNVNSDEFGLFLGSNPILAEAMSALRAQGREQRAAELGYIEFAKARGSVLAVPVLSRADAERKEIDLAEREKVRIEARDAALKDAGIVHGSAGGSSAVESPGITGASQADIDGLAEAMRREGGDHGIGGAASKRWRNAVINLPPEFFGGR